MNRLLIITLALSLMFGCSRSGLIEQRIGERVDGCSPEAPCVIRITDLTDFQWDRMYVFSVGAYPEYIEEALDTPLPDHVEFKRRIVFLKDGRIVHCEDEPTEVSGMVDGQVSFPGMNTEPSHVSFTPDSAVFTATTFKHAGKVGYRLTQVN